MHHLYTMLTPKRLATTIAVAAGLALLAGCSSTTPVSTPTTSASAVALTGGITWSDFGGPTNTARYTAYFNDFLADTGVKVTSVVQSPAIADQMFSGQAGPYDAVHQALDKIYSEQNYVQELPKSVPRDTNLPADVRDYAFATFYVGHAQGYLAKTFPSGGPQTWADFWDVKKFPGKRAWPGSPGSYDSTCEIALLADGVKPADLYPLDLARCDKKMDELRPNMVFYTSYPQIQTLLSSGTVAIAAGPSGQFAALNNAGIKTTVSWDQAIVAPNAIAIPKTAPDKANIFALAKLMNDPARQAVFAKLTNYGPGNPDAFKYMDDSTKASLVNAPGHTTVVYQDSKARAKVTDALLANYTKWLANAK